MSENLYAAYGGYFLDIIKGMGVIGSLTVSSLAQEDDHQLVTPAIKEYWNYQN